MEEENIVKDNKKKIIIGSIGIVLLLLIVVVIGSTYAYFSLNVTGDGTNTKVTITTGSSNQIKLSGGLEDFHIKLEVKDMAYNRQGDYYATSDKNLNYETDKKNVLTEIGRVEVIGELEDKQVCNAKAKVTLDGSMSTLIKEGDLEISLVSEDGLYTNTSDLTKIKDNYPATLEFVITDKSIHYIKAYLKFTNRNIDQSYLAGQELKVNIIIEDFECNTDSESPNAEEFYFNEKGEGQQYTSSLENTLHLSWTDTDVSEYCITQEQDTTHCEWKKTNGIQSIQEEITLDGKEGDHIYYGYIKDKIGNISPRVSASIIYDVTNPTINKFYIKEEGSTKYTNKLTNKVYFQYNDNNIKDMCVTEEQTSESCKWTTIGPNMDYTFANNTEGLKTIYGYVRDKANNISTTVMTDRITYDITLPTINTITDIELGETSVTLKVIPNENLTEISQYCYSLNSSDAGTCVTSTDGNITIKGLKDGQSYTYYFHLIDKAGNSGISNKTPHTFKTKSTSALNVLQSTTTETYLKTVAENDELLRYVGTQEDVTNGNIKNFICFGTDNKETCLNNKETYMYRIIGITTSNVNTQLGLVANQLKIILAYPKDSTKGMVWNSDYQSTIIWEYAEIQKNYLNATFLSSITGTVGTHQWSDLISEPKWYIAENNTNNGTWTLTAEKDKTTLSTNHKVGLMYASDYYDGCNKNPNTSCWLYVKNGLSTSSNLVHPADIEWTMSRQGRSLKAERAYNVASDGTLWGNAVGNTSAVRPVFYLTPVITLTGGGKESDPFIIHAS